MSAEPETVEAADDQPEIPGMIRITVWCDENERMETQYGPQRFLRWLGLEQERFERSGIRTEIYRLLGRAALFKYANKSP